MGNGLSTKETPEQRRERLVRQHGVLMPPSFVNGDTLPLSRRAKLLGAQATTPSLLEYLWITNPGARLLGEYARPTICLNVPTTTGGNILVNLQYHQGKPSPKSGKPSDPLTPVSVLPSSISSAPSTLWASHPLVLPTPGSLPIKLELLVPTNRSPSVLLTTSGEKLALTARFVAESEAEDGGGGWIEAKYKTKLLPGNGGGMDLLVSSWLTTDSLKGLGNDAWSFLRKDWSAGGSSQLPKPGSLVSKQKESSLHLQAGLDYEESMLAVQTEVPWSVFTSQDKLIAYTPKVESLLSINLNHQSESPNSGVNDVKAPPLWLTLKHQPSNLQKSSWILNLAQVFTFDRVVINPMEERAPNIRQTFGWAVQVEKQSREYRDHESNASTAPSWSAGATYQWNRGMACKALLVNGESLTYGVILKRWNQPRITLSALNSYHFPSSKHSFLGFGVEVESAPLTLGTPQTSAEYPDEPNVSPVAPPPTKIHLPHHKR